MAEKIITVILFIPIILILLYQIYYPRESILYGKRWQFQNQDLEPSEDAIKYTKTVSKIVLVGVVLMLILVLFKQW